MVTVTVFVLLLVSAYVSAAAAAACNRTWPIAVPYPFGFTADCEIQLNYSEAGEMMVGEFKVRNLTSESILVNIPAKCNRSIEELRQLEGDNFLMTWRNGLLLDNCSAPLHGCALPIGLLRAELGGQSCAEASSMSCYSDPLHKGNETLFLNVDEIKNASCNFVVSSIALALDMPFQPYEGNFSGNISDSGNVSDSSSTSLMLSFHTVELGWWLNGTCHCDSSAACYNLTLPSGRHGYRCKCKEGFAGDGFAGNGSAGCKMISRCNSSVHVFGRCGGKKVGILIGGILCGAVLMAALVVFCFCIRRRTKMLQNQMSTKRLLTEAAGNSSIPIYFYKDIERATFGFSEKQRLGTGAYGTVYVGKLRDDEPVAIKKIKHRDHESIENLMNEIKLLSSVSHPNLVRLLGCCIENGEQILVYEYMPNGTLSQHLQRSKGSVLPWTTRLTIATETANAIAHLHSAMNPPIYHRDIKSSNILLDFHYRSKVADFGLSRFGMMDDSHISTAPQGTPGYLDPQYHQNFHLSDKSDVYSLGVVLVEIITAKKVVDFSRPHSEINLAALAIDKIGKGRLDEIIDPYLEPNRDAWTLSSIHKVAELAFRCLAFHRDMRPSMMEVAEELEQIRMSSWAPLDDTICMGSSVASSCSSPFNVSEKSFASRSAKKSGIGSRRVIISQRGMDRDSLSAMEETKDSSPVSVQDPWFSEQSSPSTNSLLNNVVQ